LTIAQRVRRHQGSVNIRGVNLNDAPKPPPYQSMSSASSSPIWPNSPQQTRRTAPPGFFVSTKPHAKPLEQLSRRELLDLWNQNKKILNEPYGDLWRSIHPATVLILIFCVGHRQPRLTINGFSPNNRSSRRSLGWRQ
jgi:hypothetical protein